MKPPTVICWKWRPQPGYRSAFGPETVHVLKRMVERHYAKLERFVCVTDDPTGLDGIETFPLWPDFQDVPSPHGGNNPSCYRRLKAFSPDAAEWFGERFVSMDLDTVICGDLSPLFDRTEDFICWGDTNPQSFYNGSIWMMTAGARRQVWERFDPKTSPREARSAGKYGSDQGWFSYVLGPNEAKWTKGDGVYSYRNHLSMRPDLPANARVVNFHGSIDPWHPRAQRIEWVQRCYQ